MRSDPIVKTMSELQDMITFAVFCRWNMLHCVIGIVRRTSSSNGVINVSINANYCRHRANKKR